MARVKVFGQFLAAAALRVRPDRRRGRLAAHLRLLRSTAGAGHRKRVRRRFDRRV